MATALPERVEKYVQEVDADLAKLDAEIKAHQEKIQPKIDERDALLDFKDRMTGRSTSRNGRRSSGGGASSGPRTERGGRLRQLIETVTAEPGLTVSEVAAKIGVAPNYLYRIRDKATADGKIRQDDEGKLYLAAA